jgi:hypothetical protein
MRNPAGRQPHTSATITTTKYLLNTALPPAHPPVHPPTHPRPPVPQQRGRHRRGRHQHEAPGTPSNTQTPANQAARSKHKRTPCARPSGRPPKPPETRRRTHAGGSRRRRGRRVDQPATQASRQSSHEQINHHKRQQKNKRRRRRNLNEVLGDTIHRTPSTKCEHTH